MKCRAPWGELTRRAQQIFSEQLLDKLRMYSAIGLFSTSIFLALSGKYLWRYLASSAALLKVWDISSSNEEDYVVVGDASLGIISLWFSWCGLPFSVYLSLAIVLSSMMLWYRASILKNGNLLTRSGNYNLGKDRFHLISIKQVFLVTTTSVDEPIF